MANLQIFKVNALPEGAGLVANAIYYVKNGGKFDVYVTSSAGVATLQNVVTETQVNTIVSQAMANVNSATIVTNIAERDALIPTLNSNTFVFVQDASADATVDAGAALYLFNNANDTFIKVSEYESMDLNISLDWANITNKPTSTVTQIDSAVATAHTHANKAQLDKIGEDGTGALTYNGQAVSAQWAATQW
ncbi:hypothetical protein [Chryseobacterium sp.]|uniref:hypothetical protein n=1 Tax=Chryseobacterium sp. TaxID=1871047 RepID=UPI0035AD9CC1